MNELQERSLETIPDPIHWLISCPWLETLEMDRAQEDDYSLPQQEDATATRISSRGSGSPFPDSIKVSKLNIWDDFLTAMEVTEILEWCPRLTELALSVDDLDKSSFMKALSSHFDKLTVLDRYDCRNIDPWIIQQILISCNQLLIFTRPKLDMVDFLEGTSTSSQAEGDDLACWMLLLGIQDDASAPDRSWMTSSSWVCVRLQKLKIGHLRWFYKDTASGRRAMQHFKGLKQLEELIIGQASLARGPDTLEDERTQNPWKKGFYHRCQLKQDPETQWMVESWSKLKFYQHAWTSP